MKSNSEKKPKEMKSSSEKNKLKWSMNEKKA